MFPLYPHHHTINRAATMLLAYHNQQGLSYGSEQALAIKNQMGNRSIYDTTSSIGFVLMVSGRTRNLPVGGFFQSKMTTGKFI